MENVTNLDTVIDSVNLVERTAKSGVRYEMLQLNFDGGYKIEMMLPERAQGQLIHKIVDDSNKK